MSRRFWTRVYSVLWYAADWVLTSRLNIPNEHPLRRCAHLHAANPPGGPDGA